MKMRNIILGLGFFLGIYPAFSQNEKVEAQANGENFKANVGIKSALISSGLPLDLVHNGSGSKWAISVRPTFSRTHILPEVQVLKDAKNLDKAASFKKGTSIEPKSSVSTPIVGMNYEGNWSTQATPPDNSMAVSNGGYVVTTNNDGAEYYNSSGTLLYSEFWSDFFGDPNYTAMLYDPKIVYDSQADRFVLIVLHGSTGATSKVVVSFSKTNNPIDGWWVYTLNGNPLNNNNWFDYPNLGVSNDEVFVTGNLFTDAGVGTESVIYQIPKAQGYSGANFNWQYWSGLDNSVIPATSLVPAMSGVQGNYGPGIYLIGNHFAGSNKVVLWDLTNNISGNPQLNFYSVNTTAYSPAADANQLGSSETLSSGDCRIKSAFYLNGTVHFVFHSDGGNGWIGINYNRLNVSNQSNVSSMFSQAGSYDLAYPAVASYSMNANEKSVMIAYLRSSPTIYPELRVVNCDDNMNWSSSTLVKSGETNINFLNGNERWGDYTGISRKHNSSIPKIWLAGCYGANIPQANTGNTYKTWVAEITGQNQPVSLEEKIAQNDIRIFPIPSYDFINIEFTLEEREPITIEIVDLNGQLVKSLYKDTPKLGENKLIFNKGALTEGSYFVRIYSASKIYKNEKIVILN